MNYILVQQTIYPKHIEDPKGFEGQGIGGKLVKAVLQNIAGKDYRLIHCVLS